MCQIARSYTNYFEMQGAYCFRVARFFDLPTKVAKNYIYFAEGNETRSADLNVLVG